MSNSLAKLPRIITMFLFIEIFVNHKLKVFMKSVMAGKRSIKEVLVSVACKVLLKIKAQYTWHAAVICQWAWCPELAHKLFCLYKIKKIQCNGMTTSLEIEPVMNMSNSAEMTTALWVETNTGYNRKACFFYILMTSHILWLFTVILEVTNCDFLQLFWILGGI